LIDVVEDKLAFEFQAKEKRTPSKKRGSGKKGDDGGSGCGPADPRTPSGDKVPELVT